jgi:hypothetical protein
MSDETISADELCELTGLTDRRHRQLAKDGYFPPPARGRYKRTRTLQGLFKYAFHDKNNAGGTLGAEKLRKLKEEADRVALENARERKELVDRADLLKRFEPIYTEMRQRILNSGLKDQEKDSLMASIAKLHE